MKISSSFPSKFLKAVDLAGHEVTVTIDRCIVESMTQEADGDSKPVVYFAGKTKGLALNKTNATIIADEYGDETEHWEGKKLILYPAKTQFQGGLVDCIRVRIPGKVGESETPF